MEIMKNSLDINLFYCILFGGICFFNYIPYLFYGLVEKKVFTDLVGHGIDKPWFDHIILYFLCSKFRIITFGLNNFSCEVAILIFVTDKHKNELRPLEIVIPIQLVTYDGEKRDIGSSKVIGSDNLQPRVDFRD